MLVDSHCHLDYLENEGRLEGALAAAKEANVGYLLSVGTSLTSFPKILTIAQQHNNIFATVGIHPSEVLDNEPTAEDISSLANNPLVVGIGETGLDYFHKFVNQETQIKRLQNHIHAAKEVHKPLIIHTRDSAQDILAILKKERADLVGGIMHCFTENWEVAQQAMDLNFYIAFSGIVTFPKALQVKEVAKKVPLDRILIETDSPYLAPVPFRGKPNQPAYVQYVAKCLSELKELTFNDVANSTTENFLCLFPIIK